MTNRSLRYFLLLGICAHLPLALAVETVSMQSPTGLTADELEVEAPGSKPTALAASPEVAALRLSLSVEGLYSGAGGEDLVDVLEQDYVYVTVQLETESGVAVVGVEPTISLKGSSRVLRLMESSSGQATDAEGFFEFAVIGGKMGLDRLAVKAGDAGAELAINVISLDAAGYASPDSIEGALSWRSLTEAKVSYGDNGGVTTTFPVAIQKQGGKRVKLAGFMVPLEAVREQKHFLLTSNPPSCFFHTPGGPAGAVEVFASKGVGADWELMVMEGRLELLDSSAEGMVYQLHDAVLAD